MAEEFELPVAKRQRLENEDNLTSKSRGSRLFAPFRVRFCDLYMTPRLTRH